MTESPLPHVLARMQTGVMLLESGRPVQAIATFRRAISDQPGLSDGHRLLGIALRVVRDAPGAEDSLRAALALDPTSGPAAYVLAQLLLEAGRAEEALVTILPVSTTAAADVHLLTAKGDALKRLGRLEEARSAYAGAATAAPESAAAAHNLASIDGDLDDLEASEAAARRALALGLDAPETWLVLARALVGLGHAVEAEAAYRAAIARRSDDVVAQAELAQLVWMRTGDIGAAGAALDLAIGLHPRLQVLALKKAELLQSAGDTNGALAAIAAAVAADEAEPMTHVMAARLVMAREPARALGHARAAVSLSPNHRLAQGALCEAHLASGDPAAAATIASRMRATAPLDQHFIGLLATAWRLLGDPRYRRLYDYEGVVQVAMIDVPNGWRSLDTFLADVSADLARLHAFRTHPVGQSVRHGSQTTRRLSRVADASIQAFFQAADGAIRRHIAALGPGDDPVRARVCSDYRFNGEWSVRLPPGGYHTSHLHPRGWLSSACYISLPRAVAAGEGGWLKFGEPGVPTAPQLAPEHFVKPEPGMIVLFPSYMWHGTTAFSGDGARLTVAFDVVPSTEALN